ncbi:MAG TPA: ATP-binding protein [Pirellulales bacterium]|nr:ATP-binding protein [Pirellulales bacterium]
MQASPRERASTAGSLRNAEAVRKLWTAQLLCWLDLRRERRQIAANARANGTRFSYGLDEVVRATGAAQGLARAKLVIAFRYRATILSSFMSDNPHDPTSDSQTWARSLVRPLARRYLLVLASVAALVLVDQAILQPLLVQLNFTAPVINLAGRQRMLSQKVTKEVLALVMTDDIEARVSRRDELLGALEQWAVAHGALLDGDPSRGVQPVEADVAAAMQQIEPAFVAIRAAASEIATDRSVAGVSGMSPEVTVILGQEPIYLRGMENVVAMLQESAKVRVTWLRGYGMIAMTAVIMLLVGVYFLVLQPAANLIRNQVEEIAASDTRHRLLAEMLSEARDTLELRVAARTSEVLAANVALECEMLERQAAELRMRELSSDLAHASRVTALGQLATGLAHEINQPLATLANYAGMLELALQRSCPTEEEPRQLVAQIRHAALRAGAIVRRMRNFVRRGRVQTSQVDLNDLVREVSELCRSELRDANVQLTLDLAPQPVLALADAVQIQQVLVNLIHNAVQAMASTPDPKRALRIATHAGPLKVGVSVLDSGPGLPSNIIAICFQPFLSTRPDGLGMGLAISRSIVEQHQGRIWSENRECGGAVVGFSLPHLHANDINTEQYNHANCVCG